MHWYCTIDSTNTQAKKLAAAGAPHGTVLVAGHQQAGRGRMGRSFSSPEGSGMYLSVILRPNCTPDRLMHLTCAVAVAMCQAVEDVTALRPGIKWINDLVIGKRKLGGILTEMSISPGSGVVDYAIVGVGINCTQQQTDFPAQLQSIATSLAMEGFCVSPAALTAAAIHRLWQMDQQLLEEKVRWMEKYKENCITLGQQIMLNRADQIRYGTAIDLDDDGALVVRFPDGCVETVSSGEASVRGMYGYV